MRTFKSRVRRLAAQQLLLGVAFVFGAVACGNPKCDELEKKLDKLGYGLTTSGPKIIAKAVGQCKAGELSDDALACLLRAESMRDSTHCPR